MATKPTVKSFATADTASIRKPADGFLRRGFQLTQMPVNFFNWIFNNIYRWIQYFDENLGIQASFQHTYTSDAKTHRVSLPFTLADDQNIADQITVYKRSEGTIAGVGANEWRALNQNVTETSRSITLSSNTLRHPTITIAPEKNTYTNTIFDLNPLGNSYNLKTDLAPRPNAFRLGTIGDNPKPADNITISNMEYSLPSANLNNLMFDVGQIEDILNNIFLSSFLNISSNSFYIALANTEDDVENGNCILYDLGSSFKGYPNRPVISTLPSGDFAFWNDTHFWRRGDDNRKIYNAYRIRDLQLDSDLSINLNTINSDLIGVMHIDNTYAYVRSQTQIRRINLSNLTLDSVYNIAGPEYAGAGDGFIGGIADTGTHLYFPDKVYFDSTSISNKQVTFTAQTGYFNITYSPVDNGVSQLRFVTTASTPNNRWQVYYTGSKTPNNIVVNGRAFALTKVSGQDIYETAAVSDSAFQVSASTLGPWGLNVTFSDNSYWNEVSLVLKAFNKSTGAADTSADRDITSLINDEITGTLSTLSSTTGASVTISGLIYHVNKFYIAINYSDNTTEDSFILSINNLDTPSKDRKMQLNTLTGANPYAIVNSGVSLERRLGLSIWNNNLVLRINASSTEFITSIQGTTNLSGDLITTFFIDLRPTLLQTPSAPIFSFNGTESHFTDNLAVSFDGIASKTNIRYLAAYSNAVVVNEVFSFVNSITLGGTSPPFKLEGYSYNTVTNKLKIILSGTGITANSFYNVSIGNTEGLKASDATFDQTALSYEWDIADNPTPETGNYDFIFRSVGSGITVFNWDVFSNDNYNFQFANMKNYIHFHSDASNNDEFLIRKN